MTKLIASIFRSPKKEGMYLFVDKKLGLERVPVELLELFGQPEHAMTLLITPEKKLARTDAQTVLDQIQVQGYYLQMPPVEDNYMQVINEQNSKLSAGP